MAETLLVPSGVAQTAASIDPELQAFSDYLKFFREEFAKPGFLDGVPCSDRIRAYVPHYYRKTFGPGSKHLDGRQLKWFRRLRSLLSLPKGSTIVDYGGGYGLDSIFLASRGYKMVFFEITLSHIAVAEHFAARWRAERGPIEFRSILRDRTGMEPFGHVDAVLLDEVAHHIEPVEGVFAKCATILKPGGRIFLLEPNAWSPVAQAYFFKVRGFKTTLWMTDESTGEQFLYGNEHIRFPCVWKGIAKRCGFELAKREFVVPYGMNTPESMNASWRTAIEQTPGLRMFAATHVTSVFRRMR